MVLTDYPLLLPLNPYKLDKMRSCDLRGHSIISFLRLNKEKLLFNSEYVSFNLISNFHKIGSKKDSKVGYVP